MPQLNRYYIHYDGTGDPLVDGTTDLETLCELCAYERHQEEGMEVQIAEEMTERDADIEGAMCFDCDCTWYDD